MSQNNTRVPGVNDVPNNFYSRTMPEQNPNATVVPGMSGLQNGAQFVAPAQPVAAANSHGVPVVGFLYSISRQGIGEYWPLHIGRNTIGRSAQNDICLQERTVSELHASINIKQLKSTKKLLASIRDEGSKTGIFLNKEELDYGIHECANHDLITIGDNYVLLLILIDAEEMGLKVSENFLPSTVEEAPVLPEVPDFRDQNPTGSLYDPSNRNAGGTVSMDGTPQPQQGRTKFL